MTRPVLKLPTEIQWQRGTTENLAENNPILRNCEPCIDTDLGIFKVGDGVHGWNELGPGRTYLNAAQVIEAIEALVGEGGEGSDSRIGDMADLSTTDKSSIVDAINEINVPAVSYALLYENAKAG